MMGCICVNTITSIALTSGLTDVADAFGVSNFVASLTSLGYQINFIPMNILTTVLYKKVKRHNVLRIASLLMIFGSWFRQLS